MEKNQQRTMDLKEILVLKTATKNTILVSKVFISLSKNIPLLKIKDFTVSLSRTFAHSACLREFTLFTLIQSRPVPSRQEDQLACIIDLVTRGTG